MKVYDYLNRPPLVMDLTMSDWLRDEYRRLDTDCQTAWASTPPERRARLHIVHGTPAVLDDLGPMTLGHVACALVPIEGT